MVIEKTRVRIKETGEVRAVLQIRIDRRDIVISQEGKKYIYPFDAFNFIPCLGVYRDINDWDIYHRDFLTFTGDGASQAGFLYFNEPVARWEVYTNTGAMFFPQEISNIKVVGNDMNTNWQDWRNNYGSV